LRLNSPAGIIYDDERQFQNGNAAGVRTGIQGISLTPSGGSGIENNFIGLGLPPLARRLNLPNRQTPSRIIERSNS
jgi:hypothetical protein